MNSFIIGLGSLFILGQVFLPHRNGAPTTSTGITQPSDLSGLAWWWVASDLPVGQPVTNWVDRIQHVAWTNSAGDATVPTNTALGVFFSGANNQRLKTTNVVVYNNTSTNNATFVALLTRTGTGSFQTLLSYSNGGNFNWQWDVSQWELYRSGVKYIPTVRPGTNVWFDWAFTTVNSTPQYSYAYTNGVPYETNAVYLLDDSNTSFGQMGGVTSQSFTGYLTELIIYTNVSQVITNIPTIHTYFTNTYPGRLNP